MDPENFVRVGPTFTTVFFFHFFFFFFVFLVDEGKEDPNTTTNEPSSARQRNAIEMAFQWRFADGPKMAQH